MFAVLELTKQRFEMVILSPEDAEQNRGLPVQALLDKVQRSVTKLRAQHPELSRYKLHDVRLRVTDCRLVASFEFRS